VGSGRGDIAGGWRVGFRRVGCQESGGGWTDVECQESSGKLAPLAGVE